MVMRGRNGGGRRSRQEKFEEAKARGIEGAEWLDSYGVALLLSETVESIRHDVREGWLPPARKDTKPHQWKRSDLLAREELRRLELFGDWRELVQGHGEHVAWAVMLKRLASKQAELEAQAREVA
jgi:hypothetical protein